LPAAFRFAFPEGPVQLRRSAAESPLPEKRKPVEIPSCCYALVDFTERQKPRYMPGNSGKNNPLSVSNLFIGRIFIPLSI